MALPVNESDEPSPAPDKPTGAPPAPVIERAPVEDTP